MSKEVSHLYEFGPFRIDVAERLLLREGEAVPLTPKAFETLLLLVESRGHTVEKDELMRRLWPDTFVEEANLTNNISLLRKGLEESPNGHEYIRTVPRRGHRFVGDVRTLVAQETDAAIERLVETSERATEPDKVAAAQQVTFVGWRRNRAWAALIVLAAVAGGAFWFLSDNRLQPELQVVPLTTY